MSLKGKTIFITGATRGIGLAIALRAAADGANIVIAAKTDTPHPKLEGTLSTAAQAIEAAGGRCLACKCDIRNADQVQNAIEKAVQTFGGIDILINNASAISLTGTLDTPVKMYDLMNQVNARGTCLQPKWFKDHTAYTIAKYGMSMCVLGMSEEFKGQVAVNALWPKTLVATAAVNMLGGESLMSQARKPEIMADAAYYILTKPHETCTGNFFIDENVLMQEGGLSHKDLDRYAYKPGEELSPDIFIDEVTAPAYSQPAPNQLLAKL